MGLDPDYLDDLDEYLTEEEHRIHSVLIVKEGALVYECYFADQMAMVDYEVYQSIEFDQYTPNLLFSSSKSVISILAGIAIEQGFIQDINTTIATLLPQYADLLSPEQQQITFKNALDMAIEIDFDEWRAGENGASRLQAGHPWYDFSQVSDEERVPFVVGRENRCAPGSCFQYSGGAVELTARAIEAASGMPLDQFAEQYLFSPLGISQHSWLQRAGGGIAYDWGLSLTARDFAKLGQLYLNEGKWELDDGEKTNSLQIVSAQWVKESYQSVFPSVSYGMGYSRYWYHPKYAASNGFFKEPSLVPVLMSHGYGNQIVYIFPEQDMVVVLTGGEWLHSPNLLWLPSAHIQQIMALPHELITEYVLPAAIGRSVKYLEH